MNRLIDYLTDWVQLTNEVMNIYLDIPIVVERGFIQEEEGVKIVKIDLNIGGTRRLITVENSRLLTKAIEKAVRENAFPLHASLIWVGRNWWLA